MKGRQLLRKKQYLWSKQKYLNYIRAEFRRYHTYNVPQEVLEAYYPLCMQEKLTVYQARLLISRDEGMRRNLKTTYNDERVEMCGASEPITNYVVNVYDKLDINVVNDNLKTIYTINSRNTRKYVLKLRFICKYGDDYGIDVTPLIRRILTSSQLPTPKIVGSFYDWFKGVYPHAVYVNKKPIGTYNVRTQTFLPTMGDWKG